MIAAASLFAAVRVWRLGIVMTDNEVIVRGFTRTKRIPLADVERFDMSSPGVLRRDGMGRLWLRSGRHVWLWQIAPPHKAFFPNSRSPAVVVGTTRARAHSAPLTSS